MQKAALAGIFVLGVSLIALGLFLQPRAEESRPKRNVVFIVIDTLRADRLHATRNGRAVMPNLARLAGEGAEFTHAVAQCSWTRPSLASILTGVYVDAHQVFYGVNSEDPDNPTSDLLPGDWVTLPEYLASHGYDNYAFITNANLSYALGFGQGYAEGQYIFGNNVRAEEVTTRTLKDIPGLKEPFFVYAHFIDPHVPYEPPADALGAIGELPEIAPEDQIIFDHFMDFYMECVYVMLGVRQERTLPELSERGRERVRMLYDLECHYVDQHVARLIGGVRSKYPDTLFVVTSDHGEEFWERGGMGHGTTLYEEQIAVPLIAVGPEIAPRKIDATTELIGILPTLAAYLGLPALSAWQGRDWFSPAAQAPAFARTYGPWRGLNVDAEGLWQADFKAIRDNTRGKVVLYDLGADPAERRDIAGENAAEAESAVQQLDAHRAANEKLRRADKASNEQKLDPETIERLRQLGYFGDDPPQPKKDAAPE